MIFAWNKMVVFHVFNSRVYVCIYMYIYSTWAGSTCLTPKTPAQTSAGPCRPRLCRALWLPLSECPKCRVERRAVIRWHCLRQRHYAAGRMEKWRRDWVKLSAFQQTNISDVYATHCYTVMNSYVLWILTVLVSMPRFVCSSPRKWDHRIIPKSAVRKGMSRSYVAAFTLVLKNPTLVNSRIVSNC